MLFENPSMKNTKTLRVIQRRYFSQAQDVNKFYVIYYEQNKFKIFIKMCKSTPF